jgi:vacuolar protein sorting-associated protein 16
MAMSSIANNVCTPSTASYLVLVTAS